MPAEARRVPLGANDDAQEAELGAAKDHARAAVERQGSNRVHSGRRPLAARAQHRARARRAYPGFARCALPGGPRSSRHARRARSEAVTQPLRREEGLIKQLAISCWLLARTNHNQSSSGLTANS